MEYTLNGHFTLMLAALVSLLGKFLVQRIKFLSDFSIPEPVAGGLVAAAIVTVLHATMDFSFNIEKSLQTAFMLIFFASIGLSADFGRLRAGGKPLVIFFLVVAAFMVIQNAVGTGMSLAMGIEPLTGLLAGSISLTGGHGTAGAWGQTFETRYGFSGATTLGIACATYGLVSGGIIGGPLARRLIDKMGIQPKDGAPIATAAPAPAALAVDDTAPVHVEHDGLEDKEERHPISINSTIETLGLFAICLVSADLLSGAFKDSALQLPSFVWALMTGVLLRNGMGLFTKRFQRYDHAIDVFGNVGLSLFLALALLSLKLWELGGLAGPVIAILAVQTLVMVLYAYFVTFRVMGGDYDAAVLAAGHCGFGMGATPTAIANMQAITDRYMPSHKAFLIVPMVGAFLVDLANVTILQAFTKLPFMGH